MELTFNDAEFSENGKAGRAKSDVAIYGAPFDMGTSGHAGQRLAPTAIRMAGVWPENMGSIKDHGVDPMELLKVVDCGDALIIPGDFTGGLKAIEDLTRKVYDNSRFSIMLGGDHSATAPAIRAISEKEKAPLTVFHFDAHGDYDKHDSGVSHNHGTWVRWVLENGYANRVVQFGVRGWGYNKSSLNWADKNDIITTTSEDPQTRKRLMDELAATSDPIYLSVDVDVLDPAFAPGVAFPEPGGYTSRQLLQMVWDVVQDKSTVAMDIMEVIPSRDQSDLTVKIANRLVAQGMTAYACRE